MLFTGCVGEGLFSRVNKSYGPCAQVNGIGPSVPEKQVCCGALHAHAGDLAGARALARQNINAFSANENVPVVTNAGGCGGHARIYGHLLSSVKHSLLLRVNSAKEFATSVSN